MYKIKSYLIFIIFSLNKRIMMEFFKPAEIEREYEGSFWATVSDYRGFYFTHKQSVMGRCNLLSLPQ